MIKNLIVENFKCFPDRKNIPLRQFNLLTGINGNGKSTLIQVLLLFSQSLDSKQNENLNRIFINGDLVKLGTFGDIKNRQNPSEIIKFSFVTNSNNNKDDEFDFSYKVVPNKCRLAELNELIINSKNQFGQIQKDNPKMINNGDENNEKKLTLFSFSQYQSFQDIQDITYVSADRKGPVNLVEKDDNLKEDFVGINGEHVLNVLGEQNSSFIERVNKELSAILCGASLNTINHDKSNFIQLMLDSNNDSLGFKPVNVGFGYSYVLPIILSVLLSKENSIVVIENPEAHLHPGAQSRMVEFLLKYRKEKKLQMIIETHSDHIINGLRIAVKKNAINKKEAEILHFVKNKDGNDVEVKQISIDKNGTLSDYPDDFMDEWTKQMMDLI